MKKLLLPAMIAMALLVPTIPALAAPKAKKPSTGTFLFHDKGDKEAVIEFQGDDLAMALRTLARKAQMNLVIAADVQDVITLRLEDKTPKEAIEIIANMSDLLIDFKNDVYYIENRVPKPVAAVATPKSNNLTAADLETFVPLMTKFLDILLDYEARPQTAQKIALSKKALMEALVAQGFTREEAFKLLLAEPGVSFFGMKR